MLVLIKLNQMSNKREVEIPLASDLVDRATLIWSLHGLWKLWIQGRHNRPWYRVNSDTVLETLSRFVKKN